VTFISATVPTEKDKENPLLKLAQLVDLDAASVDDEEETKKKMPSYEQMMGFNKAMKRGSG
jgi:hypothetical protein